MIKSVGMFISATVSFFTHLYKFFNAPVHLCKFAFPQCIMATWSWLHLSICLCAPPCLCLQLQCFFNRGITQYRRMKFCSIIYTMWWHLSHWTNFWSRWPICAEINVTLMCSWFVSISNRLNRFFKHQIDY